MPGEAECSGTGTGPIPRTGLGDNWAVTSDLDASVAARLKRDPNGLVPAIVQQFDTGEVLMMAWMNRDALEETLRTGRACSCWTSRWVAWTPESARRRPR